MRVYVDSADARSVFQNGSYVIIAQPPFFTSIIYCAHYIDNSRNKDYNACIIIDLETKKMQNKQHSRTITIGNAIKDQELIKLILEYQKQKGLSSAPDAVRELCFDALAIKKATK